MIILQDVFDTLAHGELSNIFLRNNTHATLEESQYKRVVSHINMGLMELYKRFNLRESSLTLHTHKDVTTYYLRANRVGDLYEMGSEHYILSQDTDVCVEGDLLEIIEILDSDGVIMPFNDKSQKNPIKTLAFDILQLTPADPADILTVNYKAGHPKIDVSYNFDPTDIELELPPVLLEPLLAYVAFRVYKPMGANSSAEDADKSIAYQRDYELSCQKIDTFGLDMQQNNTSENFERNGWA